jgi:copper oxidase (laccase) domain-containing protein
VELGRWRALVLSPEDKITNDLLFSKQVHGGRIVSVECLKNKECEADGIVSDVSDGVVVGVVTADCVPVVIATDKRVVVLHVSRKTLIRGLLENVRNIISFKDIESVFIGPHICENHFSFENKGEEIQEFIDRYPMAREKRDGKVYLSMRQALQVFFDKWGVKNEKIIEDGRCTYESDQLSSYKRWREGESVEKLPLIRTIVWLGK